MLIAGRPAAIARPMATAGGPAFGTSPETAPAAALA
eukprot:CAMPEP_0114694046 /NCGR_PEP_ID=MMETSP0191-20121206/69734_1 /TAXON_ID=126664 /ORGANISM="Sorites sp." /LENGTH=35 /DNA_ID= /DNA_START= /DNA_END= /DNA_ORIENTATION=